MSELHQGNQTQVPVTVHCTQCGKSMRVAPEHLETRVACPHCSTVLEPWRMAGVPASPPPIPSDPGGYPPRTAETIRIERPQVEPAQHVRPANLHTPAAVSSTPNREPWAAASWRNRWIAGALAILLGPFGVHRFYLGYTGTGILMCLLTICSFGLLAWVVAIWAFVEGILCFAGAFRDVDGNPLNG
jgi:hypothetical protein